MWKRIATWYKEWEQEQLDVLVDPALAAGTAPGYRRYVALKLAELSPIERQQLHAFSTKYRGRDFLVAIARLVLVFSLLGLVLHVFKSEKFGVLEAIIAGNAIGFGLVMAVLGVWFNSRKISERKVRLVAIVVGAATIGELSRIIPFARQ